MAEKKLNARIIHKHDIEENWLKATNFIPQKGEIIIYDADEKHMYSRMKIGDGVTIISQLPFVNNKEESITLGDELIFQCGNSNF